MVDGKLDMNQQCVLAAQKDRQTLGEGGDAAPLLCIVKTSPGVLCLDAESSGQERHRPVRVFPKEGHRNDPRDGIPLL